MTALDVSSALAAVAVSDIDAGTAWYASLFGREPDARPMASLTEWHVGDHDVVQVVLDPGRAGGSLVTLRVDEITAARDALGERGVHLRLEETSSAGTAFGVVEDPDGNAITVVGRSRRPSAGTASDT